MFKIINASAGSGKTYNLVKEYLVKLLSTNSNDEFKNIVALTFTNKAVFEMKQRIISVLSSFSEKNKRDFDSMFNLIKSELNISDRHLQSKSRIVLKKILHDFSNFEIQTLDRFTLKIVRSFYRDLDLSYKFHVELNSKIILEEVVERIINKVGKDQIISELLKRYSFQKMEETLSNDISSNLFLIAKLLIREQDISNLNELSAFSIYDFSEQEIKLRKMSKSIESNINNIGKEALKLICSKNLDYNDFKRKLVPNHFEDLKKSNFNKLFKNNLELNLKNREDIYNKTLEDHKKEIIDAIIPKLFNWFKKSKKEYYQYLFIKGLTKHWIPISLVKLMKDELELIQKETNTFLLATFNHKINKTIIGYPTPYIYEKIGERYNHFFIDEFQDTSKLQWENLIPLISNSLENIENNKTGSLLLVGDPKQSIYRWRGGDVNQFIELLENKTPFQINSKIKNLDTNYRSSEIIVNFNNLFFKSIIPEFSNEKIDLVFKSATNQFSNNDKKGYVQIEQISSNFKNFNYDQTYCEKTINKIEKSLSMNYKYGDIAILVRKKSQAAKVAEKLSENNIPFISSESLLVSSSSKVKFLISLIKLTLDENCKFNRKIILDFFFNRFNYEDKDYHFFINDLIKKDINQIFHKKCKEFDFDKFKSMTLYNGLDYAIYSFGLSLEVDSYVSNLLELAFLFAKENGNDYFSFINYWEKNKPDLYVPTIESKNSIQILTIHKSKGLEFPIVILPFMDEYIQPRVKDQVWIDIRKISKDFFPLSLINFSKNLKMFGKKGQEIYKKVFHENEIDSLNLLYVSLTRAINCMYIITKKEKSLNNSYSALFQNFIAINKLSLDKKNIVEFGKIKKLENSKNNNKYNDEIKFYEKRFSWEEKLVKNYLFDRKRKSKRELGIVIHELLSKIDSVSDIELAVNNAVSNGKIFSNQSTEIIELLNKIVQNSIIKRYFSSEYKSYKEREILCPNQKNLRIDRLLVKNKQAIIMDYKTGLKRKEDIIQLDKYEEMINQTNLVVSKKILVYLSYDPIEIDMC